MEDAEDFSFFMLKDFSYNVETVMLAPAEGFYLIIKKERVYGWQKI